MKKNEKKLAPKTKKLIKFLVERYLEVSLEELRTTMDNEKVVDQYWQNLSQALFSGGFWMDEPDPEDMNNTDYKALVIEYHELLKPLWEQFKIGLFDYQNVVVPERELSLAIIRNPESLKKAELDEYRDLYIQSDRSLEEKFYDVMVQLKVSFDSGSISFYKRKLSAIENFLDLLKGLPVTIFSQCQHCNKCIIKTRSDKEFCPGCAAKKYQMDKWKHDPEVMRLKEKQRYQSKRKSKK